MAMQIQGVIGSGGMQPKKPDSPERVHDAAQQFEALMIAQMMKSIREGGDSWLGTGDDAAGGTAIEMAEEQFAKAMSLSGGLGLAKMVEAGLAQKATPPPHGLQKLNENLLSSGSSSAAISQD